MAESIETVDSECQQKLAQRGLGFLYPAGMQLHEWIRAARKHWGRNQEDLGEALGVTKANVSAWETGRHEPSFGQVMRIASTTRFDLSQLDDWPAEPAPSFGDRPSNDAGRMSPGELLVLVAERIKWLPAEKRSVVLSTAALLLTTGNRLYGQAIDAEVHGQKTLEPREDAAYRLIARSLAEEIRAKGKPLNPDEFLAQVDELAAQEAERRRQLVEREQSLDQHQTTHPAV